MDKSPDSAEGGSPSSLRMKSWIVGVSPLRVADLSHTHSVQPTHTHDAEVILQRIISLDGIWQEARHHCSQAEDPLQLKR